MKGDFVDELDVHVPFSLKLSSKTLFTYILNDTSNATDSVFAIVSKLHKILK